MSDIPFLKDLGLEILEMKDGDSEIALDLVWRHTNSWNVIHGGVTMTLLDVCMARAARSLDPEATAAATVEMKTNFFQPGGTEGDRMIARGRVLHQTKTLYYCEGELWNGDKLIAKAMGTFKTIRRTNVAKRMKKQQDVS